MKKLLALMTAGAMALSLAACGGSASSTASSAADSTADASSTEETSSATPAAGGKTYKIGFTDNYNGNSYHQSMEKYMQ